MEAEKSLGAIAAFHGQLFIPGAFDRWELIQAQKLHNQLRIKQSLQQLNSEITDITSWLKEMEAELEMLKTAEPPSDIREMELRVKRLKVRAGMEGRGIQSVHVDVGSAGPARPICQWCGWQAADRPGSMTSVTGQDMEVDFGFQKSICT